MAIDDGKLFFDAITMVSSQLLEASAAAKKRTKRVRDGDSSMGPPKRRVQPAAIYASSLFTQAAAPSVQLPDAVANAGDVIAPL